MFYIQKTEIIQGLDYKFLYSINPDKEEKWILMKPFAETFNTKLSAENKVEQLGLNDTPEVSVIEL